ncbi:MAG: sugar phosphate isomerase/epimerase family protein [Bacteroidota bacterium]
MSIQRRTFIKQSAAAVSGLAALSLAGCVAPAPGRNWGIQLFTIPKWCSDDFTGTLRKLSDLGYRELELFGPYPFSDQSTKDSWKGLAEQMSIPNTGFYGMEVPELKKLLSDLGLTVPSVHLDLATMRNGMHPAMEQFATLGARYAAIPALMGQPISTLDDFKRFAEEFNGFGKQMKEHGITFVYHNHGYEHAPKDGRIPMDVLIEETDPELVKFELDIFWMQAAGADPVAYLKKYPGRFRLMHVKDAAEPVRFSGDGSTADQWMAIFGKMADPGTGVFDIKGMIAAGVESGVEHFYLEHDLTRNPETTLTNSINYFKTIG